MILLLLPACLDYRLHGKETEPPATDTGFTWAPDTSATRDTGVGCPAPADLPLVNVDESCLSVPDVGSVASVVEWQSRFLGDYPEYSHTLTVPVVGPLFDGDGDGDVDANDPPSIAAVMDDGGAEADFHGVLRVLDGATGTPLTVISRVDLDPTQVFPYRYSNLALGDVDGDGRAEIVGVATVVGGAPDPGTGDTGSSDPPEGGDTGIIVMPGPTQEDPCRAVAWTPDGDLLWLSDEPLPCGGHAPALADLEGDGAVEVILGASVFDGATGALRWQGEDGEGRPQDFSEAGYMSFAADLDGDGEQEVLAGSAIYEADGTVRCTTGDDDGFPGAADLDGAGDGEMVVVADGRLSVYGSDCRQRMTRALVGDGFGGPPTLGDLDADGLPEIGVATGEAYTTYEADGTPLWTIPTTDTSSSTSGAAFYDFDGDGALEVVYADETTFWILDGRSGAVRLEDTSHSSRTLHEYPVVVDVDGDGEAEIVVPNGGAHDDTVATGMYVRGSARNDWTTARSVWNQHAFAGVNVNDDLTIPSVPEPSWPTWNTFRSGTIDPVSGGASPNAVPEAEPCYARCDDGVLVVDTSVANGGMAGLRAGLDVRIYAEDTLLAEGRTTTVIRSGDRSPTERFTLTTTASTLTLVVDEDDRARECHEDDNTVELEGCP